MSRDGKAERITRKVGGRSSTNGPRVACGGALRSRYGGRYRTCTLGHVHCTHCLRIAHRFGKTYTCGMCKPK